MRELAAAADSAPAARAAAVVEAVGVSLTYETRDGPVNALADIDLAIAKGDFVSLIGPSGCGKTTLLRAIADLERPTGGPLRVNGKSAEAARPGASTAMSSRRRRCFPGGRSSAT